MTSPSSTTQSVDQTEIHQRSRELAPVFSGYYPLSWMMRCRGSKPNLGGSKAVSWDTAAFTPFRLRQGVYGQRQADVQMIRIKIPGGILTPESLDGMGEIAERYAPLKKGHNPLLAKNIQMHPHSLGRLPRRTAGRWATWG